MILGFGADLVHVPRIQAILARRSPANFARRILSDTEFAEWKSGHGSKHVGAAQWFAVRWAVKEATYKALYPVYRPTFKELSYHKLGSLGPGSKPTVTYLPRVGTDVEISAIHCSVSHDGEYVFASVVVEK